MSHFCVLVLIPAKTRNVESAVSKLMERWNEEQNPEEGTWDWYELGGRYTGALTEYDPRQDPRNQEPCRYCHATGKRTDAVARANPALLERCNGCSGTGKAIKFQFAPYEGDVQPVKKVPKDYFPFAIVTPDGNWHQLGQMHSFAYVTECKEEEVWKAEVQGLLAKYPRCKAVVVDCHT